MKKIYKILIAAISAFAIPLVAVAITTVPWQRTNSNAVSPLYINDRVGIGTTTPSYDLGFGGGVSRTIGVERSLSSTGTALTTLAGGALQGGYDLAGGDLYFKSGVATGYAGSAQHFYTSQKITTGGLGTVTIDLDPLQTYGGWVVGETAYDDYFGGGAIATVATINGSGQPTSITVTNIGSGYTLNQYLYLNDHPEAKYITFATNEITGNSDNALIERLRIKENGNIELNPASGTGTDLSTLQLNDTGQVYALNTYSSSNPLVGFSVDYTGSVNARTLVLSSAEPSLGTSIGLIGGALTVFDSNQETLATISRTGSIDTISNITNPQGGLGTYQNLLSFSEQLDRSVWVKTQCTVTADTTTAPNGTLTMDTIAATGASPQLSQTVVAPITGTVTASVYVQSAGSVLGQFNISSGGTSGTAFAAGTQVKRVVLSKSVTAGNNISIFFSSFAGGTFYAWGLQLEYSTSAGPYIKTLDQPVSSSNGVAVSGVNNLFQGNNAFGHNTPLYPIDILGTLNGSIIQAPIAPSVPNPTSGGSVTTGTHSWKVTYVTAYGETTPSSKSTVRTAGANKTFAVTIPVGPTGTIARKIYRTVAGDTGAWKLVTTVADNTSTTTSDTLADGSLGADAPTINTTATLAVSTGGTTAMFIDSSQLIGVGTTTPATNLHITGTTTTLRLGEATTNKTGCFEMFDSVNTTTLMYIYPASGILTSTSTKPAFCK